MLQFTYYGHACFLINTGKEKILFDPFLTDNPLAAVKAEEVDCSYMLISHAHSDHFADAPSIAVRTGAEVVAVPEVAALFPGHSVHFHTMNIGGSYSFPFGKVTMVNAVHSCGAPGGHACGWIIRFNGGCTLILRGIQPSRQIWNYGENNIKLIMQYFLLEIISPWDLMMHAGRHPCSGHCFVIPVHYNTWPVIVQDPEKFQHMTETKTPSRVLIVHPGGSAALDG